VVHVLWVAGEQYTSAGKVVVWMSMLDVVGAAVVVVGAELRRTAAAKRSMRRTGTTWAASVRPTRTLPLHLRYKTQQSAWRSETGSSLPGIPSELVGGGAGAVVAHMDDGKWMSLAEVQPVPTSCTPRTAR
jgi:hypothetical protein